MTLLNQSKKSVIVKVNENNMGVLLPGKSIFIYLYEKEAMKLTLSHEKDSYKRSGKAYMNIETTFEFPESTDIAELIITYGEMHVESGVYYSCLFLSQSGKYLEPVHYEIQGLDELKSVFSRREIKQCLLDALLELLLDFLMAPVITIIGAIVIVLWLGWKWLLIVLLVLYLFSLLGEIFGEWFSDIIARLFLKDYVKESMVQKIERLSQIDKIAEYYNDPDGSRYMYNK